MSVVPHDSLVPVVRAHMRLVDQLSVLPLELDTPCVSLYPSVVVRDENVEPPREDVDATPMLQPDVFATLLDTLDAVPLETPLVTLWVVLVPSE